MIQINKLLSAVLLCALLGSGVTAYAPFKVTTVFLVRHAEKQSNASDAELSEIGHKRAKRLAEALAKAGVKAIYTSQYQRTKQTGTPLAQALNLTMTEIKVESVQANSGQMMAKTVLSPLTLKNYHDAILNNAGQTALIVGHSNTVPELIAKLGVTQPVTIPDNENDNLYIVTIYAKGKATLAHVKY